MKNAEEAEEAEERVDLGLGLGQHDVAELLKVGGSQATGVSDGGYTTPDPCAVGMGRISLRLVHVSMYVDEPRCHNLPLDINDLGGFFSWD